VDVDEDSEATPSPPPKPREKNTPPHHSVLFVDQTLLNLETTPEVNQAKPQTPPSEKEPQKSLEPEIQNNPNSEAIENPNPPENVVEKSPHHVVMDNTFTAEIQISPQLQEISRELDLAEKIPIPSSDVNSYMQNLSHQCIYVPPHLPSRILNEPISDTREDITKLLQAVDKNIRRINMAIPKMSIESAGIDKECDRMEDELQNMMKAIRESYKRDLAVRKELTRLEAERI
jgi:hypothetical protein